MDLRLDGKTALVTGSYRGTGAGIAQILAAEGARVWVHGFEPGQPDPVVEQIRGAGGDALGVVADIRRDEGASGLCAEVGEVDVLVNNYGVAEGGSWERSETADWVDIYQKNVLSAVRLIRAFTPGMRERGFGRVILISTVGAIRPNKRMPQYYASKAALVNIAVSLAKELAGTGITANTVSPGLIATREVRARFTRMAAERGEPTDWHSVQKLALAEFMPNPSGIVGEPEDVGALVAYLASPLARYVNGCQIRIDGGAADTAV